MAITTVHVKEVGMALPDVIYMRVRDQEIVKGTLLQLASPDASALNSIVQRDPVTGGAGSAYCRVTGALNGTQKMFLRFSGTVPTAYLDRAAVDNVSNWPTIGGRTVTAVYRKTKPYDQEACLPSGTAVNAVTMEHELFIQLDDDLPQGGPYTLSVTGNTFPSTDFTFDDTVTRACGLHASAVGFRPGEKRKLTDFHLWIPGYGTEGRTNIVGDYSLTAFDVINRSGTVVYSGTFSEVIDPTTAESGVTNPNYASTTTAPKVATGVTNANPCEITIVGHGYSNGQKKYLRGFAQSNGNILSAIDGLHHTITVTGADTFTIPVNTTSTPVWAAGEFSSGYDSLVFDSFAANRYNTYVHRADFSAWITGGYYRIRIPGLGVSDEFLIDDSVHYADALLHAKGYYNQASGIALNGFGGVTRPIDFKDGENGVVIYKSNCPAYFADETGTAVATNTTYNVVGSAPMRSPWITGTRITGWGGSIRDAGDWDYHAWRHCVMAYWLLEFAYRQLPAATRNLSFGFPKASVTVDAVTYADIDALGDQVHMALLQLDVWRKFQQPDGRVYGGLQMDGGSSGGGGGDLSSPSWYSHYSAAVLEADPQSNLEYAAAAAKMAHVFQEAGFTSLATLWENSAVAAYDWSEAMYQDYVANGATGSVVQQFFVTDTGYKGTKGLSDPNFATAMSTLFGANYVNTRHYAIGCLYSLTDDTAYGDIIAALNLALGHQTELQAKAAWEFVQAPSAVNYTTPSPQVAYYNSRWSVALTASRPQTEQLRSFFSGTRNQDHAALKNLHDAVSVDSGRNQQGISKTAGLGARYPLNTLLRDREAVGETTEDWVGTPVYYNFTNLPTSGLAVFNFSTDAPVNYTVETPTGIYESTYGSKRIISPISSQTPIKECFWDNSFVIYCTEFTAQQTIAPRFISAVVRHTFDENTDTEGPETEPEPEPEVVVTGGWIDPKAIEENDTRKKRIKKNELAIEQTIRLAHQRLSGKVTEPEILKRKPTPQRLAIHAEKLAAQLVEKSKDSAKQRTRNKAIIAELKRQADIIMREEEEAIVILLH